jgi:uncharacterized membrane protein YqiK
MFPLAVPLACGIIVIVILLCILRIVKVLKHRRMKNARQGQKVESKKVFGTAETESGYPLLVQLARHILYQYI